MSNPQFRTDELAVSQLPAMLLLAKMGWKPLTRVAADEARRGRLSAVLLEDITREFLRNQTLSWGEQETKLTEDNIDKLIASLKDLPSATYGKQAEDIWDRLVLPQSVEQSLNGTKRAINVKLIDFDNLENNLYHMVSEYVVERSRSNKTRRPDIVLFVNGIPLAVIENKKAATDVLEGVSQSIRNQKPDNIPQLYVYAQLLLAVNKNNNRYGTTGTPRKLWNKWREKQLHDLDIQGIMNAELSDDEYRVIVDELAFGADTHADLAEPDRLVTDQDRALVGLCRPDHLLHMMRNFILFDGPNKVIARFQQVNAVNKTLARLQGQESEQRSGGVIWHTQGSGKSLTMVMLARALIGQSSLNNARIVLVTDRVDLDKQIKGTFKNTGMEPVRANTGRELVDLIRDGKTGVVTTIINKFETAAREKAIDDSSEIFVLIDEGHRTQYGRYQAQMRRVFPNACYLAFTGTPIAKKDRSTMDKFGDLIDTYTMRDAVEDGAVIPLIYEGRMIEPEMDEISLDKWFERITNGLTNEQKADLKQKYSRANMLSKLDKVVTCRAFDISEHYRSNFQDTGLKGQLVAPDKKTAIKYKQALDEIGHVSSEVLISGPDSRKGHEEVDEGDADDAVVAFWEQMMRRWGNEEKYNEGLISQFKNSDNPEIIIVVSKLLTGFDAPRNAVLYLTKRFNEADTLLQAIARVNRVLDTEDTSFNIDKDAGFIIDYEGILENLDKAITSYEAMAGYSEEDLQETFVSTTDILHDVPQKHAALLDVFKTLNNSADEEAYEQYLRDEEIRNNFYEALYEFSKALNKAFSLADFYDVTPNDTVERYKRDLKKFINLRTAVKRRYGEKIDFRDYEKRIEKLLHDYVSATEIEQVLPPINIFDISEVADAEDKLSSDAAKADMIASNMKRIFTERMIENPALYDELSVLLKKVIDEFINKRLAESEYLDQVRELHSRVIKGSIDDVPASLADDPDAAAFHGYLISSSLCNHEDYEEPVIAFAKFISDCFSRHKTVSMFQRPDVLNKIRLELDDYMYDYLIYKSEMNITTDEMDEIQERILEIADSRSL